MRIRGLRPLGRGPRIRPEDFVPGLRDPWQTSGRVRMRGVHLSGDFRGIRAFHGGMGGLGMSHPAGGHHRMRMHGMSRTGLGGHELLRKPVDEKLRERNVPVLTRDRLNEAVSDRDEQSRLHPLVDDRGGELVDGDVELAGDRREVDRTRFHFGRNRAQKMPVGRRAHEHADGLFAGLKLRASSGIFSSLESLLFPFPPDAGG